MAKLSRGMVQLTQFHEGYKNPFRAEEEIIEMVAIFPGDLGQRMSVPEGASELFEHHRTLP
jgi:hypothetical protein